MVKSLRNIFFRTLLATIYENFCSGPPLEKTLGAPLQFSVRADRRGGRSDHRVLPAQVLTRSAGYRRNL